MGYRSRNWGAIRNDNMLNVLNGLNSRMDPSRAVKTTLGKIWDMQESDILFHTNGTFRKIITCPADEAVRSGFALMADDKNEIDVNLQVLNILDDLGIEEVLSTALYWNRTYGGACILPIFDGGGLLEEPLDVNSLRSIIDLRVYSARECSWFFRNSDPNSVQYGQPEMYTINDQLTGKSFQVHASRLIIFPGDAVPHHVRQERRGWGGFVLETIADQLLYKYDCANDYTMALIQRLSQGILKIQGMNELVSSDPDRLRKYLSMIDMTRSILNTMAVDGNDDFDLKNITLNGLEKVLDKFQTALSAVTEIPVTILFGRSPGGQNSTGDSDFQQYYASVQRIQRRVLKQRINQLVKLVGACSAYKIKLPAVWMVQFNPLSIPSDLDKANTDFIEAQAENQRSQARQNYVHIQALDPPEVRAKLQAEGSFEIDDSIDETAQNPPDDNGTAGARMLEAGEMD